MSCYILCIGRPAPVVLSPIILLQEIFSQTAFFDHKKPSSSTDYFLKVYSVMLQLYPKAHPASCSSTSTSTSTSSSSYSSKLINFQQTSHDKLTTSAGNCSLLLTWPCHRSVGTKRLNNPRRWRQFGRARRPLWLWSNRGISRPWRRSEELARGSVCVCCDLAQSGKGVGLGGKKKGGKERGAIQFLNTPWACVFEPRPLGWGLGDQLREPRDAQKRPGYQHICLNLGRHLILFFSLAFWASIFLASPILPSSPLLPWTTGAGGGHGGMDKARTMLTVWQYFT